MNALIPIHVSTWRRRNNKSTAIYVWLVIYTLFCLFPLGILGQGSYPPCYICHNDSSVSSISNGGLSIDVSDLNLGDSIYEVTCQQLFDAGVAGFIPPDSCTQLHTDTDRILECGCPLKQIGTTTKRTKSIKTTFFVSMTQIHCQQQQLLLLLQLLQLQLLIGHL